MKMNRKISFGTDGWRGILAEDFTFDNVRLVTRAVAGYLHGQGLAERGVVVGYDNRFLSERFAAAVTGVLTGQRIPVYLTGRSAPTPLVAFAVKLHNAGGAVMLTASHNPPEYNGFKFIPEYAGPALPHITGEIENNIKRLQAEEGALDFPADDPDGNLVTTIDPFQEYARHLATLVDLEAIRKAGLKVAVDPMYGAGTGYLEDLLKQAGVSVTAIHNHRDPLFGGGMPEPTAESLGELRELVTKGGMHLGLALDGDADRFGIIDANGEFITPNQYLPILFYHLLNARGMRGPAARTVATTHQLDRIAERYGLTVEETSVGFKYIGQCLAEKGAVLGGEESGGLSVQGHVPEKDGLLAGLLAAEMVAFYGTGLTGLLNRVAEEFGRVYSRRLDVHTTQAEKERVLGVLKNLEPGALAGYRVTGRNALDGVKLLLEGGAWVLIRPSGTEPLFRIYVEAATLDDVHEIQQEARKALGL